MEKQLDLYTDFLLATVGQATATGLSRAVDGAVSHDSITRFLNEHSFSSKDLWQSVKLLVRKHETADGCLIFDDSIVEKAYMSENPLFCWHFDHSTGKSVKGIMTMVKSRQ